MSQSRSLAVELETRDLAYTSRRSEFSKIRLCGCWLTEAGFAPGTRVTVTVEQARIVITPESSAPALSPELEAERLRITQRLSAAA